MLCVPVLGFGYFQGFEYVIKAKFPTEWPVYDDSTAAVQHIQGKSVTLYYFYLSSDHNMIKGQTLWLHWSDIPSLDSGGGGTLSLQWSCYSLKTPIHKIWTTEEI